jgi:hypothetical protein
VNGGDGHLGVLFLSDYKGYVRLICEEACRIDYHPTCWKKYKSTYGDKNADKVWVTSLLVGFNNVNRKNVFMILIYQCQK